MGNDLISRVADVTIAVSSTGVQQAGFGTPLCAVGTVPATWGSDLVRSYASLDEMIADSWTALMSGYRMAAAAFAQSPCPETVKVGKLSTAFTPVCTLTATIATQNFVYSFTVVDSSTGASSAITYTVPGSATVTSVGAALAALIDTALSAAYTVTNATGTITITAASAGTPPVRVIRASRTQVAALTHKATTVSASTNLTDGLTAIEAYDSDWYGLALECDSEDIAPEAAAWCESRRKIYVVGVSDDVALTSASTDVASLLKTSTYTKSPVFVLLGDTGAYHACAWLGRMLATVPGGATWYAKTLAGIPADDLTSTQIGYLSSKNATGYVSVGGVNVTFPENSAGKVPSGEWVDIIVGIAWTQTRIREEVWAVIQANDKVPYTDVGVGLIVGAIAGVLQTGVGNGLFADTPSFTVAAPKVSAVSATNKRNRKLPDVKFTAPLAGAIHYTAISGKVSV